MFSDFDDVDRSLADAPSVFREVNNFHDIDNMKFADEESVKQLKEYFTTFFQAYGEDMRGKYHGIWNMLADIYECVKSSREISSTLYKFFGYLCQKRIFHDIPSIFKSNSTALPRGENLSSSFFVSFLLGTMSFLYFSISILLKAQTR